MTSQDIAEPNAQLDALIGPWLEVFDLDLTEAEVPLSDRPLRALLRLLREKIIQVHAGDEPYPVDDGKLLEHLDQVWFRALYVRVERWYQRAYGAEAIRGKSTRLEGAVLIRGAIYALSVPTLRNVVHVEGREAWMYFENSVAEGEDAVRWLRDPPDLAGFDAERRAEVETAALEVATALRVIHFHRMGVNADDAAEGLADAAREYIQSAARRLCTAKPRDLGPAWFDLQMAAESALKLVLQMRTGTYRQTHDLRWLLAKATPFGVDFEAQRLVGWPDFRAMSDLRYAQGDPGGLLTVYDAYRVILDLVAAAMATIKTPIAPGGGILMRRPAWLMDDANVTGAVLGTEAQSESDGSDDSAD